MTWEVVVTVTEAALVHGRCDRVPVGVSSGGWQTGQAGWRAMSCSPSRCQPATCAARAAPTRGSINILCSWGGLQTSYCIPAHCRAGKLAAVPPIGVTIQPRTALLVGLI